MITPSSSSALTGPTGPTGLIGCLRLVRSIRSLGLIAVLAALGCASPVQREPREQRALPTHPARPMLGKPIERVGRPLTKNALIGPLDPAESSNSRKEAYNRAGPADWPSFAADLQRTLALYDGFDGSCGNQWLVDRGPDPAQRYHRLAALFADDRLWVDSRSTTCTRYLAVEQAALSGGATGDCGGRTPISDAIDEFRSLLVLGAPTGLDDGVDHDDRVHSATDFPFLAAP